MTQLALKLPGGAEILPPDGFNKNYTNLGSFVTGALELVLYVAGTLMLSWFAWGVFQYLFAGGDKEGMASAQKRITYAIVGFLIVVIAFALTEYLKGVFPDQTPKVTPFL